MITFSVTRAFKSPDSKPMDSAGTAACTTDPGERSDDVVKDPSSIEVTTRRRETVSDGIPEWSDFEAIGGLVFLTFGVSWN